MNVKERKKKESYKERKEGRRHGANILFCGLHIV